MPSTYTIYFGTNRMPEVGPDGETVVGFGSNLGPIDGTALRFGSAQVSVDKDKASMVKGSLYVADETLTGANVVRDSADIFEKLRADMKDGGKPTLVLVHGFSNSFTDAIERAGTIRAFYGLNVNIFAYSWPSRGSVIPVPLPYTDYVHDRETSRASGQAMARTMRILFDFVDGLDPAKLCRQPLHLLCHSMGVYAFRHALQALLQAPISAPREYALPVDSTKGDRPDELPALTALPTEAPDSNRLRRTFEQIILAAGGEDDDAFDDSRELKFLPRLGNQVTIYHTTKDWVLSTLSQYTKFNGPRLGMNGPDNMGTISGSDCLLVQVGVV
jgi:esterase/lipase superfamily enzyme